MKTTHVKGADVESRWYLYDASEHVLGRMAAEIARRLQGKDRPTYTPSEPSGDFVVVVNSAASFVTGRKNEQKEYQTYSGYPDGRRVVSMDYARERRPNEIVKLAVRRMLPKSILGKQLLSRLKVYEGLEHPHGAQLPERVPSTR